MPLILARLSRQATCHLDCRSTHQLADVLRYRGRAHPSLLELSQLLRDAMGACSQFMKHAREGKVPAALSFVTWEEMGSYLKHLTFGAEIERVNESKLAFRI
jgi:hypothetical protein